MKLMMDFYSKMTEDNFTLVKKGQKLCAQKKRNGKPNNCDFQNIAQSSIINWPQLTSRVGRTNFFKSFFASFADILNLKYRKSSSDNRLDVVVYGLGNFFAFPSARDQLAFVLYLKNSLLPSYSVRLFAFDPQFTSEQKSLLSENGFEILNENERGLRTITKTTLFFMPHCCRSLTNNVLYANWAEKYLSNLFILGNSFSSLEETFVFEGDHYKYLSAANTFCTEIEMEATSVEDSENAFNDTSLHYFDDDAIVPFPRDEQEPVYSPDCEMIMD